MAITVQALKRLELFEDIDEDYLSHIAHHFKEHHFKRNEIVYTNDASARHFYFLISGRIKIFRLSELGKEQIIRLIEPKEFTGELAVFEGIRKAYATTLKESIVYSVEHADFKQILKDNADISLKMIEILSLRLHLSEEQTSWLSTNTSKERLWIYLNKESVLENNKLLVHQKVTKRFIAAYLGMTSETLSRVLHQLEEEGRILIHSENLLEIIPRD